MSLSPHYALLTCALVSVKRSEYEDGPYPKNVWPPSHLCGSYWKNFQSWMCTIFQFLSQQIWHCTSKYKTLFPKQTPRNSSNLLPVKNSDIHPAPLSEKKECIFHFMNWKCTSFQVYVSFISFFSGLFKIICQFMLAL